MAWLGGFGFESLDPRDPNHRDPNQQAKSLAEDMCELYMIPSLLLLCLNLGPMRPPGQRPSLSHAASRQEKCLNLCPFAFSRILHVTHCNPLKV